MNSDVVLRRAKAADTDALAEIWHVSLCSMTGVSESLILSRARCLERLLTEGPGWQIVVADAGDGIAAFVAWIAADGQGEGWLRELFVHPAAQGRRFGSRLLGAARAEMPMGFWLRTPADNVGGRRFYEREGLRFDGLRQDDGLPFTSAIYRWAGTLSS
ncbi:GNAT family N-acetyltransferase [Tanticharoenia sakaeratensis]|uniref:N-acetyltransferase domain-containing protein n=1 Tax=Tanticharoenia sakaeratensis NBRC 103193 TaxID=1231623 RepID=A0A0D6MHB8_9PROT|nr:GNAT family N-acetyltransferase [Tanticharoenia sakaeratensis]GAN53022.1 hypothetical protein Tasa_004_087 [Tanticharoenia sakaeratensis NBRC 103193]GBQ19750.1 acetyltransferase [Tanticharoenia sakaeratensis NBRC 103193]